MADLIPRAAAIEAIVSLTAFKSEDELKKFVEENACYDYYIAGLCDAIDEIKDTTAADAVPVIHAFWADEPDRYRHWHCSNCGKVQGVVAIGMKYCPECGATMYEHPWAASGCGQAFSPD